MQKPWFRRSDYHILFPIPFSLQGWIFWTITMILGVVLIFLSKFFLLGLLMCVYSVVAFLKMDQG